MDRGADLPLEDFVGVLSLNAGTLTEKIVKLREDVGHVDPKELAAA